MSYIGEEQKEEESRMLRQTCYACRLMMNGRNNGKKMMATRIVQHAFEIIFLLTDQNPIQVCDLAFFVPSRLTVAWPHTGCR